MSAGTRHYREPVTERERDTLAALARHNRCGLTPTRDQLAAELEVTPNRVGQLLTGLRAAGLVSGYWLTSEGEAVLG